MPREMHSFIVQRISTGQSHNYYRTTRDVHFIGISHDLIVRFIWNDLDIFFPRVSNFLLFMSAQKW